MTPALINVGKNVGKNVSHLKLVRFFFRAMEFFKLARWETDLRNLSNFREFLTVAPKSTSPSCALKMTRI